MNEVESITSFADGNTAGYLNAVSEMAFFKRVHLIGQEVEAPSQETYANVVPSLGKTGGDSNVNEGKVMPSNKQHFYSSMAARRSSRDIEYLGTIVPR